MEENITFLNDDELDGVVGGSFNQEIVTQHKLKVTSLRNPDGSHKMDGVMIDIARSNPDGSLMRPYNRMTSDSALGRIIEEGNVVSLSVENTSGQMVQLSKDEIASFIIKDS